MSKLVSIVIPCYNTGTIINETYEALENQTEKDFEVIFINDGSTDNTLELLREIESKASFDVKLINQENAGVSSARNKGIDVAEGEYIMFLDSDDIYHPSMLQYMKKAAVEYCADTVFCRYSRNLQVVRSFSAAITPVYLSIKDSQRKLLYEMGQYSFACYLYKHSILLEKGIRFDLDTKHFEDREFNWKYLCSCKSCVWLDAPLYGYRITENSATTGMAKWNLDSWNAVQRVLDYVDETKSPIVDEIRRYLPARIVWSKAKQFAQAEDKSLFPRLQKEFDVRKFMKVTLREDHNKLVRISSLLYLIHPSIYYFLVRLMRGR